MTHGLLGYLIFGDGLHEFVVYEEAVEIFDFFFHGVGGFKFGGAAFFSVIDARVDGFSE